MKDALGRSRVVTIVGALGAGTTSLATRASDECLELFPDGAWIVDVAGAGLPSLLDQVVADAGLVRGPAARPVRHALVDALRTRSILLVLDACEHAVAECRELALELVATCPGVSVLSAGTEGLRIGGEVLVPLPRREPEEDVGHGVAQLGAPERRLLRRLSALGRSPSLRCAEATCTGDELPADRVMEAASALVARNLVSWEGPADRLRVRMRDEVRPHAAAMLAASREGDGVAARLARWCMSHVAEAETDMPAVRAALSWAARTSPDVALRLAVAMRPAWERGRVSEGRVWLSAALGARGATPAARAPALALAGELAIEQGDLAHAKPWLDEAVEIARRVGDGPTVATALRELSRSALARSDDRVASALAERAVAAARDGAPQLVGAALMAHAAAVEASGDDRAARARLDDALAAFRASRDARGAASALNALGALAARNGYLETARSHLEESLVLRRGVGEREGEAATLANLAAVANEQGELATAIACQRAAVDLQRAVGSRPAIARALARLGRICRRSGDTSAARAYLEESLALQRELGDRAGVPRVLGELSVIAAASGEIGRAADLAGEALELTWGLGNDAAVAESVQRIAGLAAQAGDIARAARLYAFAEGRAPVTAGDLSPLRRVLGVVGYAEAWALGRSLVLDEAVREALDWVSASRESRRSESPPPAHAPREAPSPPPAAGP